MKMWVFICIFFIIKELVSCPPSSFFTFYVAQETLFYSSTQGGGTWRVQKCKVKTEADVIINSNNRFWYLHDAITVDRH